MKNYAVIAGPPLPFVEESLCFYKGVDDSGHKEALAAMKDEGIRIVK